MTSRVSDKDNVMGQILVNLAVTDERVKTIDEKLDDMRSSMDAHVTEDRRMFNELLEAHSAQKVMNKIAVFVAGTALTAVIVGVVAKVW